MRRWQVYKYQARKSMLVEIPDDLFEVKIKILLKLKNNIFLLFPLSPIKYNV